MFVRYPKYLEAEKGEKQSSAIMALRLTAAVQALSASLSPWPADTASHPKPPSSSRRRLATTIASTAVLLASSQLLAPASARGGVDLRITVPEESREEAEAVVRTHARNLLRVKRLIDAGAWREMQAELRASASNLKQDLYAIINASPVSQRAELRRLYSNLFYSVTNVSTILVTFLFVCLPFTQTRRHVSCSAVCVQLDYAARDKDERQVLEHYGNIVSALDEIFAKIM